MKKLLLSDYKDYSGEMPVFVKHTVRAVIMQDGRIAMQQSKTGEFKILGGVVEEDETHLDTLTREVAEEAGLIVKPDSLREIGYIEERRRDVFCKEQVYVCYTYFYFCEVEECTVELQLTECELQKGYRLVWETPQRIVECNRRLIKDRWKMRDTFFVNMLAEGKINDQ